MTEHLHEPLFCAVSLLGAHLHECVERPAHDNDHRCHCLTTWANDDLASDGLYYGTIEVGMDVRLLGSACCAHPDKVIAVHDDLQAATIRRHEAHGGKELRIPRVWCTPVAA